MDLLNRKIFNICDVTSIPTQLRTCWSDSSLRYKPDVLEREITSNHLLTNVEPPGTLAPLFFAVSRRYKIVSTRLGRAFFKQISYLNRSVLSIQPPKLYI